MRASDRPRTCLAVIIALVGALAVSASARDLQEQVRELMRRTPIEGATVAVSIWDVDSRIPLVSINEQERMTPASNMKLLTSGAALHVLGPTHEFRTALLRDGNRLIVRGDGDPAFADPDLLALMSVDGAAGIDFEAFLRFWIDAVRRSDLERVDELVVDDRVFDRELLHPEWPTDQLNRDYCAEVAGLNFHRNVVFFYPRPSSGSRPLINDYTPKLPTITVLNQATCRTGRGESSTAWASRLPGTNEITLRGNVRFAYRAPLEVTIHDPPQLFADRLAAGLRRAGIDVGTARLAEDGEELDGARVGPVVTSPIATILTRCNRDSVNLYGEALLKRLGHEITGRPGSWTNGGAALRQIVHQRLGNPEYTGRLTVSDGSGLSRGNTVTAEMLAAWLVSLNNDARLGPVFVDSLARPGEPGTLRKRFLNVDLGDAVVQAKSGYIDFVSCLSGYVTGPDGERRAFSILANDLRIGGTVGRAKRLQEQIVAAIARDLATATPIVAGEDAQRDRVIER